MTMRHVILFSAFIVTVLQIHAESQFINSEEDASLRGKRFLHGTTLLCMAQCLDLVPRSRKATRKPCFYNETIWREHIRENLHKKTLSTKPEIKEHEQSRDIGLPDGDLDLEVDATTKSSADLTTKQAEVVMQSTESSAVGKTTVQGKKLTKKEDSCGSECILTNYTCPKLTSSSKQLKSFMYSDIIKACGSEYIVSIMRDTAVQVFQHCCSLNMQPLAVETKDELECIIAISQEVGRTGLIWTTGATCSKNDFEFIWCSNMQRFPEELYRWAPDEPNEQDEDKEQCLAVDVHETEPALSGLSTEHCADRNLFVCERPALQTMKFP